MSSVTSGGSLPQQPFQLEPSVMTEIEQYMLECNYPKLERVTRRQRRAKTISEAMEHFFLAECDFQAKLLNSELDLATDEMELPRFSPSSLDKAVHATQRAIKEGFVMEKMVLLLSFPSCVNSP